MSVAVCLFCLQVVLGTLDIRPGEGWKRGVDEVRLGWSRDIPGSSAPGQILSLPMVTKDPVPEPSGCCQLGLVERSSWHPAPETWCKGWESQPAQSDAVAGLPSPLA